MWKDYRLRYRNRICNGYVLCNSTIRLGKVRQAFRGCISTCLEAAGLEAYRVDKDPSVAVPIDSIEEGIRQASVCLADITADNPNVWYELGYAFASGRPVVMVCSEERTGKKYPFDIQHRSLIPYLADSPSDFDRLRDSLEVRIKALLMMGETLQKLSEADPVAPVEGLTQAEILVLAVVAGSSFLPSNPVAVYGAKRDAERAGVTNMGFNIGVRRLTAKKFVEIGNFQDEENGQDYDGMKITESGWAWIEKKRIAICAPSSKSRNHPQRHSFLSKKKRREDDVMCENSGGWTGGPGLAVFETREDDMEVREGCGLQS
jgi:hypothetical protein